MGSHHNDPPGNEPRESEEHVTTDVAMQDVAMQDIDTNAESDIDKYGTLEGPVCTGHPDIFRVTWKVPGILRNNLCKVNSPSFEISNTQWFLLVQLKEEQDDDINRLGVFLDCASTHNNDIKVDAVFEMEAEHKDPLHSKSQSRLLYHSFNSESADWGFRELVKKDHLMDPNWGFVCDDVLTIKITVRVLRDMEVHEYLKRRKTDLWLHDPKTDTGFVGLKEMPGNDTSIPTSYMNLMLQSLFHVPALQRAVYTIPTEHETLVKRQPCGLHHPAVITRQLVANKKESVGLALQRVFYCLLHSTQSVGTQRLAKSFGWDVLTGPQHDMQDLNQILLAFLEETTTGDPIAFLFQGQLKRFVKCISVDFISERLETFNNLSLNACGCKSLTDSLDMFFEREKLDGVNKYMADGHGLQDAEMGCIFVSLPPVLHLHLTRYEYDPADPQRKNSDRFEFDETLDFAPYVEHPGLANTYHLHSVLVHNKHSEVDPSRDYCAYIRPDCKGNWLRFADEQVKVSTRAAAIEANFVCGEETGRRRFSTYMVVYVKQEAVADVLRPLVIDDIPDHLSQRFNIEEEIKALRRKEKSEAHLKFDVCVGLWKDFEEHRGAELLNWKNVQTLRMDRTATLDQLKKTIIESVCYPWELARVLYMGLLNNQSGGGEGCRTQCLLTLLPIEGSKGLRSPILQRIISMVSFQKGIPEIQDLGIWPCSERKNETTRTRLHTQMSGETALQDLPDFLCRKDSHQHEIKIFVEQLKPGAKIDDNDILIFFKFWDPNHKSLRHIGNQMFKPTTRVKAMVEEARSQFLPHLQLDDIDGFEELKPDKIEDLSYFVDSDGEQREARLQDKQVELQSGDIVVLQPAGLAGTDDCVKQHYAYLASKALEDKKEEEIRDI